MHPNLVFIGIQSTVLALRVEDGQEVWRQNLGGAFSSTFTSVTWVNGRVYACSKGEVTCLDPATGHILWRNPLRGLGTGFVTVAGGDPASAVAASQAQSQAQASAAAAAAAMVAINASHHNGS